MKSFDYSELDLLAGEVLPERAVLSTLLVGGGHGDGSTIAQNACSSYVGGSDASSGLLSSLGLGHPATYHNQFTCLPGQVVSGH